jgi:ABC-type uncharacterized transport system involved in gliding motility auxiliary subunit
MLVQLPVPFPFMPIVRQLEGDSPISQGLGEVMFPFATPLTVKPVDGVQATVLARSSKKSWLEAMPANVDPRRDWRQENPALTGPHALMVQVSGKLKSHFGAEESKGDPRLVVVGTSALVQDEFIAQSRSNQALILNVADWLLLDPALLKMRSRGLSLATLEPELSDTTRNSVKFLNALGLPFGLAMFGLARWRMREARRKTVTV